VLASGTDSTSFVAAQKSFLQYQHTKKIPELDADIVRLEKEAAQIGSYPSLRVMALDFRTRLASGFQRGLLPPFIMLTVQTYSRSGSKRCERDRVPTIEHRGGEGGG
jgi:hypothetical protein